jgi:hypothetical protein
MRFDAPQRFEEAQHKSRSDHRRYEINERQGE